MTSNNSGGMVLTVNEGPSPTDAWKMYSHTTSDNWGLGSGIQTSTATLDLGEGNYINPDHIQVSKKDGNARFFQEVVFYGSEDGENWVVLFRDRMNSSTTVSLTPIEVIYIPDTTGNVPPTVTLTSPANGTTITMGESITLTADASDADGSVNKVTFYKDGAEIGSDNVAPYTMDYTMYVAGTFDFTAVVTDNVMVEVESVPVSVTVDPMVSITPIDNSKGLFIGPNPTTGMIEIKGSYKEWKLYNLTGGMVLSGKARNVDFSGLAAGLYFLEIGSKKIKIVKK
jgi:hypothetical protein